MEQFPGDWDIQYYGNDFSPVSLITRAKKSHSFCGEGSSFCKGSTGQNLYHPFFHPTNKFVAHKTANDLSFSRFIHFTPNGVKLKFSNSFVRMMFGLPCLVLEHRKVNNVMNSADAIETTSVKKHKYKRKVLLIRCIIRRNRLKGVKLLLRKNNSLKYHGTLTLGYKASIIGVNTPANTSCCRGSQSSINAVWLLKRLREGALSYLF